MTRLKVMLVGCGKAKRSEPAQARDIYTGGLFRASLSEAEAQGGHVFVVSAEHGLLSLDELVKPYNTTLRGCTRAARSAWGKGVMTQLRRLYAAGAVDLHVFAGRTYVEPLREHLPAGWTLVEPLQGLGQGQRLAELKRRRLERQKEAGREAAHGG